MLRENFSVKGCVNDVSECRNNCRRNGLKEMRWNRIKQTSSRMSLEISASESGEKYVNEFMFAGNLFDRLWCGKLCSEVSNCINEECAKVVSCKS